MMRVGQSRTGSFVEAWMNILVGLVVGFVAQVIVFPCYGIHTSTASNIQILLWFTVVSLARSFILRRIFNAWTVR